MTPAILASFVLGPVQFDRPVWLWLLPVLGGLTLWIARRSLAGLGRGTKWTALAARLVVLALLAGALAEPSLRRTAEDVAVVAVIDASRSIPPTEQEAADGYIARAAGSKRPQDRLGTVTAARDAYVQSLPSAVQTRVERQFVGATDGTNLAEAVTLAIASAPQDAATRLVLVSDGNETAGSLLRAAEAARAVGVPIDVLPVEYRYDEEVIVEQLLTPATVRAGETISVRIVLGATRAARGRLLLTESGLPIDLDPSSEGAGLVVDLEPGKNVFTVPVSPTRPGPQSFEAVFEPIGALSPAPGGRTGTGDSIGENNRARSVTFVGSEGFVLLVREDEQESAALERALAESRIRTMAIPAAQFPTSLTELNAYECVVLVDQPAFNFTDAQQAMLRQYVHDSGGGLVMVGGPNAFGAGGWIGSPLADALPIRMDPPQKRQMPRGALAIVVHSVEIPQGVFYGKQVCNAAVDALSSLDLVGIIEYGGFGTDWVHPLTTVGDRSAARRAINQLQFGDMQTFDPSLQLALQGLRAAAAGQKHCIVISDGDPSLSNTVLAGFRDAGITISSVGVNPHSAGDFNTLARMARDTGGTFYPVTNAGLATLPQIFIKEAQTIRRSLIWEGDPFSPTIVAAGAEPMRGIRGVPPISGYIVAADREGLSIVTMRGQENDPIGAIWQHGLGKVVTFTSDATSRWAADWLAWDSYKQFWEQHIRWASRPGGSASLRITTENRGDSTLVSVEALDPEGERLDFARFQARLAGPDGAGAEVDLRQVGPGRYEAVVDTSQAGAYVLAMRYRAPGREGQPLEGSAQAAITRPFADEFRALRSNRALLRQVAQATGGRELTGDPAADGLWERAGLTMPVATRPVWLLALLVGIGVFLLDVAVRRVRIEPAAILRALRRGAGRGQDTQATQTGTLQAARAKAKAKLAGDERAQRQAARTFEPPAGATAPGPILTDRPAAPIDRPAPTPGQPDTHADALSALKRAKRRAQDEYDPNA